MQQLKIDILGSRLTTANRSRWNSWLRCKAALMSSLRDALSLHSYIEVSSSSLYEITGLSRNPFSVLPIDFDGADSCLLSSSMLQLEAVASQLDRRCFTLTKSFRSRERNVKRFAPIFEETHALELECSFGEILESIALDKLMSIAEEIIRFSISEIINENPNDLFGLGVNVQALQRMLARPFVRITHASALELLNRDPNRQNYPCSIIHPADEKRIVASFGNKPVFVTHLPSDNVFFTAKHRAKTQTYSFSLLFPYVGQLCSGSLHEIDKKVLRTQFEESALAAKISDTAANLEQPLNQMLDLLAGSKLRGGLSLIVESLFAFVLRDFDDIPLSHECNALHIPAASIIGLRDER